MVHHSLSHFKALPSMMASFPMSSILPWPSLLRSTIVGPQCGACVSVGGQRIFIFPSHNAVVELKSTVQLDLDGVTDYANIAESGGVNLLKG